MRIAFDLKNITLSCKWIPVKKSSFREKFAKTVPRRLGGAGRFAMKTSLPVQTRQVQSGCSTTGGFLLAEKSSEASGKKVEALLPRMAVVT